MLLQALCIISKPLVTLKFQGWPWMGHVFYATSSFVHNFVAICEFKTGVSVQKAQIWVKFLLSSFDLAFKPLTLTFAWTSLLSMIITFENFMMIRMQKQRMGCDGQTDVLTDGQNHRAAWSQLKNEANLRDLTAVTDQVCASFHHHMCIQTGVMVRKRLNWILTSVTLTFDLWSWPFAWTSLLSYGINPWKFHDDTMMET